MPNLSDLLYRAVDGVFAVDARQRIVLWNAACSQLLGISPKDALGHNCFEVLQGINPMGRPICQKRCNVVGLIKGSPATRAFPIHLRSSDEKNLRLWVNIILVPSLHDDSWLCVHLLRRDAPLDVLDVLQDTIPGVRPGREDNSQAGVSPPPPVPCPLSSRQRMVVELLAEGLSTVAIAEVLGIRLVTVRNHIQHIQAKLGVHSRAETVAYAYRHNLVLGTSRIRAGCPKEIAQPT
ncbi:MAG: LuxR C-terminal-related transcriptional regulator [Gammaproteobacteria bacterium]